MPMYEFDCEACGERFEDLVPVGTEAARCRLCGSDHTRRAYSAPGAPWKLIKTPGAARKQERKNAELRAGAKRRFKEARQRAREAKKSGPGSA
jgi:putative FmdB family regulatory protein